MADGKKDLIVTGHRGERPLKQGGSVAKRVLGCALRAVIVVRC